MGIIGDRIDDYLTRNEEIRERWDGIVTGGPSNKSKGTFAATDRWLAVLTDNGSFWDLDYDHITSIETDSKQTMPTWSKIAVGLMFFGFLFVWGGLQQGRIEGIGLGLLFVAVGGVIFQRNADEAEESFQSKQEITVVTDDVRESELSFSTEKDVGALLSRAIRE